MVLIEGVYHPNVYYVTIATHLNNNTSFYTDTRRFGGKTL